MSSVSEIISWRLCDIDFEARHINIRRLKKGFSTVHPLIKREKLALKNWLAIRKNWLAIIKKFSYKKKLASYKENWLTVRKNWLAIRKIG
jgi:type 1 fimbriae regulatory protein FimB